MCRSIFFSSFLVLAACSSTSETSPPPVDSGVDATPHDAGADAPHDSGSDAPADAPGADCGVLVELPPIIAVPQFDTVPDCNDVTFAVVAPDGGTGPDANAVRCGPTVLGCPQASADASVPAHCDFALVGLASQPPSTLFSVDVSKSGFVTAIVHDVHSGYGGCSDVPASRSSIALPPSSISDAGAD